MMREIFRAVDGNLNNTIDAKEFSDLTGRDR